jgi:hypothetical protein
MGIEKVKNVILVSSGKGGVDSEFTDRLNDGIMAFTKDDLKHFCNIINFDMYSE